MDGEQLKRFRAAVVDAKRGAELAGILKPLVRGGFEIGSYEQLPRVPRGFDPEHPRADLLRPERLDGPRFPRPNARSSRPKARRHAREPRQEGRAAGRVARGGDGVVATPYSEVVGRVSSNRPAAGVQLTSARRVVDR